MLLAVVVLKKVSCPVEVMHLKLKYVMSPQFDPVLNGYGTIFVPQGSQLLGVGATKVNKIKGTC